MELGITVNTLYEILKEQKKMGNGDKHIIISDDDEGNGFHTLFYGITSDKDDLYYILTLEHDGTHTVDNCVALG